MEKHYTARNKYKTKTLPLTRTKSKMGLKHLVSERKKCSRDSGKGTVSLKRLSHSNLKLVRATNNDHYGL